MTTLREAAQQALEAYSRSDYDFGIYMEALRAALAEPVPIIESEITADKREPVQEPVAWRFEARHIDSAWGAAVSLKHPGPEGVYMRNVMPLYAAPPCGANLYIDADGKPRSKA